MEYRDSCIHEWTHQSWWTPFFSIVVDHNNNPHIIYHTTDKPELTEEGYLNYNWKQGTSWVGRRIIDSVNHLVAVGWANSIAVDRYNGLHVSYLNVDNSGQWIDYKYAKSSPDATWNKETMFRLELPPGSGLNSNHGRSTSIGVDLNRAPHISYSNPVTGQLEYAKKEGNSWNSELVAYGAPPTIAEPEASFSIAVDYPNNSPHIIYFNSTEKNLAYAKKIGASWHGEWVDESGDVGRWNAIAVEPTCMTVHVIYYDKSNKSIKYALRVSPITKSLP